MTDRPAHGDPDYRNLLGLDFNAKFSFIFGVSFPLPVWHKHLSPARKNLWLGYRKFGDVMTVLLFLSSAIKLCQEYNDIRVFTTCIGTITYIICVTVKLSIFRRQVKIIYGVIDSVHRIAENLDKNPIGDRHFFVIHQAYIRHVKVFGIGKNLSIASGVGTLAFFEIAFGQMYPDKRNLPMSGWFPYDEYDEIGFIACCLFQFVSYLSFLLKDVAIDLVFLTILVSFNSYLTYLRRLLSLIVSERDEWGQKTNRTQENLIWWIKQYQLVLTTIDDFKIISNPYLFVKYISVAIILFFGGVLVTSNVVYDLVQQMIVLSINMSNLLQLYIFSVMGDKITENGLSVAEGGFDIDLLTDSRKTKMLYFYTLCRSKKPVQIQFGSINPLCVHSFGQITINNYNNACLSFIHLTVTMTYFSYIINRKLRAFSLSQDTINNSQVSQRELCVNFIFQIVKMCFSYFTTIVQIRAEQVDVKVKLHDN